VPDFKSKFILFAGVGLLLSTPALAKKSKKKKAKQPAPSAAIVSASGQNGEPYLLVFDSGDFGEDKKKARPRILVYPKMPDTVSSAPIFVKNDKGGYDEQSLMLDSATAVAPGDEESAIEEATPQNEAKPAKKSKKKKRRKKKAKDVKLNKKVNH